MNQDSTQFQAFEKRYPFKFSWQWLAVFGYVLMEMSWVVPWTQSINGAIAAVSQGVLLFISASIVLATIIVMRLANALTLQLGLRRILSVIVLVLALIAGFYLMIGTQAVNSFQGLGSQRVNNLSDFLGTIPAWFWVTIIVVALWYRGLLISRERIGPVKVFDDFRLGIVMFGLFALSSFIVPLAKTINPTPMIMVFLFAGLVSLVGSRISILGTLRGGSQSPFDRRWLMAILLATILFVVVAYGSAAVVTGQAALFFGLLAGVFLIIGGLLVTPILLLLYLLSPAVDTVRNSLPTPVATSAEGMEVVGGGATSGGGFVAWSQNAFLSPELRTLLIVLGLVVFILLLIFSVRWIAIKSRERNEVQETENLLDNQDLLKFLRQMLRNRLQETASSVRDTTRLTDRERAQAADRIRVIYADLLDLSTRLGSPRIASQTPLEFLQNLQSLFPARKAEASVITQAYLKVRYGELPETIEEIRQVEIAWEQLRKEANSRTGNIAAGSTAS